MADYYQKKNATIKIGEELLARGWNLLDYSPYKLPGLGEDYGQEARWTGIAIHPDYPGVIVCVNVSDYTVKTYSGKPSIKYGSEPAGPCDRCGGSGVEPNALTYQEALDNPQEAHKVKYDRAMGVRAYNPMATGAARYVHAWDYHEDGRPICMDCRGSGQKSRQTQEILFTWPTFQANPRSKAWHVEMNGRIINSGTGFTKCAHYDEGAKRAVKAIADEIDATARRAVSTAVSAATSGVADANATAAAALCRKARAGGITVSCQFDTVTGETIVSTEPRVGKDKYWPWTYAKGLTFDRRARVTKANRLVGADELAAYFGTVEIIEPGAQPAQVETPAPAPEAEAAPAAEAESAPVAVVAAPIPLAEEARSAEPEPAAQVEQTAAAQDAIRYFTESYPDAKWGSLHKAKKAAEQRAAELNSLGWTARVNRGRHRYTVEAQDKSYHGQIVYRMSVINNKMTMIDEAGNVVLREVTPETHHERFVPTQPTAVTIYNPANYTEQAPVVCEALHPVFEEEYLPLDWGSYDAVRQAAKVRMDALEAAGWAVNTIWQASRTHPHASAYVLQVRVPVFVRMAEAVPHRVTAGIVRDTAAPADTHLRFIIVSREVGEAMAWSFNGAVGLHKTETAASVLFVMERMADAVMAEARRQGGLLSDTLYTTEEHAIEAIPALVFRPTETPEVKEAPSPTPATDPITRIAEMRAEVEQLKAKCMDARKRDAYAEAQEAEAAWYAAADALVAFQVAYLRGQGSPLWLEEGYCFFTETIPSEGERLAIWPDEASARKARDKRAKMFRAAGWQVKTEKTDGSYVLMAINPLYDGAVVQSISGDRPSENSLKWVSPENIGERFDPLAQVAPEATAAPTAIEPAEEDALATDEAPRPVAPPVLAAAEEKAPVISLPATEPKAVEVKARRGQNKPAAIVVQFALDL